MPIPTDLLATITARLTPAGRTPAAEDAVQVWRLLFARFAPLLGPMSTSLLFEQTLAEHAHAFPWLPRARALAAPPPALDQFATSLDGLAPDQIVAANRALLTTFTAELAELVGDRLAERFLRTVFLADDMQHEKIGESGHDRQT